MCVRCEKLKTRRFNRCFSYNSKSKSRMPDPESKKNQHKKGKNDPKEQRKPRQRHQAASEKAERKIDTPKVAVPEKPVYEEPGPEFYKGLKRETDDILKITEEANSKYKKKEIQSNWAKYEIPIESYDEVEEQENMGADYEQLIQAPLSIGGHFQFKHEKSWDISTGPSLYDKYFEINMNDLATALCTIPFYERNNIDKSIFTETDIQTMDHRTSRYKHKYFKIATTESDLQEKLIKGLKEDYSKTEVVEERKNSEPDVADTSPDVDDIHFDDVEPEKSKMIPESQDNIEIVFKRGEPTIESKVNKMKPLQNEVIDPIDDIILGTNEIVDHIEKADANKVKHVPKSEVANTVVTASAEPKKNPVIESPEDLEKWLDDFLEE
ncbi:apoptosis and caspase activation inhibitor [Choristoneura fumiferana]|uniref:apoptosis and caspase activation inhibitor n=1 Tax=Choristoneura fumiferana TaxID=7141 RepID=UPI003D1589A8